MMQIGICGTFDLQNYGDLLFPLIAEKELSRRLGPFTLHRFSYHERTAPDWPYDVTSVTKLPDLAGRLDGMIMGGGHLIRFDKNIADAYYPPTPDVHHPTGYWLAPALICLHRRCPVMWNAPGVLGEVPGWAEPLMHLAFELSRYVSVRDEQAQATLTPFSRDITVVPDTCFGVMRLLDRNRPSPALSELRRSLQLTRPYILIQATGGLDSFRRMVARQAARFAGYQFLTVPIGPALGDDVAALADGFPNRVVLPDYPDPQLMAELIAGAAAVVGVSLHLGITGVAAGVPVFRPAHLFIGKYAILSSCANVHAFPEQEEIDPAWFEEKLTQRGPGRHMTEILRRLDRHWDRVASSLETGREAPAGHDCTVWQRLPALLEARANDENSGRAGRDDEIARLQAALAERDQRISDLNLLAEDSDRKIAAAEAARDRMGAEVMARNESLRALRKSRSWKLTAPLRGLARRATGNESLRAGIVRLDRIEQEPLAVLPYEWAFVDGLFSRRAARSLVQGYPHDKFKTVKGYDGEKGYQYEARALIHMNAGAPAFPEGLNAAWRSLAEDLLSPAYRAAMSRLTGRDLAAAPMEAYVCHFGPGAWLGPHVDLKDKIVTHVFYFNATWDSNDGGCLSVLRSREMSDVVAEILPVVGNSSVIVRSDHSWHCVSPVTNGCRTSRRSMNVIFYRPGAVSTMWPPGDETPLHDYQEAAVAVP